MRTAALVRRNLVYYWRTNVAVVLGVGVAVSVLAGALLVGESVRASLRDLFLRRLGSTDHVVATANFFREHLAAEMQSDARFAAAGLGAACPLVLIEGAAEHGQTRRRAGGVQVYGVDERFWEFHGRGEIAAAAAPRAGETLLSPALARELRAGAGDTVLLRVEKPSDIPVESLHGRKEDVGRTLRLTAREVLAPASLGEFSLRPQQTDVRAAFVPLRQLQKTLGREGRANAVLISAAAGAPGEEVASRTARLREVLRERATLDDLGVGLRVLAERRGIAVEAEGALLGDALAERAAAAAAESDMSAAPVFSYLANSIRSGVREVPYSLVTALDDESFERLRRAGAGARATGAAPPAEGTESGGAAPSLPPVVLNSWAAADLGAKPGDVLTLEYYLWAEDGRLVTETAQFRLAGVVPVEGDAADRELVPEYPGISGSASLAEWDPPFPVDLARIRRRDEDYWEQYKTTPKAFIELGTGQRLWQTRFGKLTSLRVRARDGRSPEQALDAYGARLKAALDPAEGGVSVHPVRAEGLEASRGATDFGEYFLYFSFFLVVSALLLAALFFRLGVEQRLREIGILQSVGFPAARVRGVFLREAAALAAAGSLLGMLGAYAYGRLMMLGLTTWWVGATGTTALELHASPTSFLLGAAGGVVAALVCIVLTLRSIGRRSTRSLLAGDLRADAPPRRAAADHTRGSRGRAADLLSAGHAAVVFGAAGACFLLAGALGWMGQTAGFFGGGGLLLLALLCGQSAWLRRRGAGGSIGGRGLAAVFRLGVRNATDRPGRSVLCITLIASAAFIIVAVDAFRRDDRAAVLERRSGSGGYALLAESLLPVVHDPNTAAGREALNLSAAGGDVDAAAGVAFARFRVKPGDDASCLNLYQPRNPRVLAPTDDFVRDGRFGFQGTLDGASAEEAENPWLLLRREPADGAVPVIADANSMAYVLHLKLGEDFLLERGAGAAPLRLRLVAALADSIFQGELLMSEKNFRRLFPEQEGHRFFLLDVPHGAGAEAAAGALEERLTDYGLDVTSTAERLASFHRVENTFLSTFQMLGALGLVLGTVGLAAVLLRNVLERRRELALLRAVGYNRPHFALMVVAENALLLACGLLTGTVCALLAVAPVIYSRGGRLPLASLGGLILAVVVSGLLASLLATAAALRTPLLSSLRAE